MKFNVIATANFKREIKRLIKKHPSLQTPTQQNYRLELVAEDPRILWGMAFLSETEILATEKGGRLYYFNQGSKQTIAGVPKVYVHDQGGLFDVSLHPDFSKNHLLYITLASTQGGNSGGNTALCRATPVDNNRPENVQLLYKAISKTRWVVERTFGSLKRWFGLGVKGLAKVHSQYVLEAIAYNLKRSPGWYVK